MKPTQRSSKGPKTIPDSRQSWPNRFSARLNFYQTWYSHPDPAEGRVRKGVCEGLTNALMNSADSRGKAALACALSGLCAALDWDLKVYSGTFCSDQGRMEKRESREVWELKGEKGAPGEGAHPQAQDQAGQRQRRPGYCSLFSRT